MKRTTCFLLTSVIYQDEAFSQNLKSGLPKCAIGPAQNSNLQQHMKKKFYIKWLSTGHLGAHHAHLAKKPDQDSEIDTYICTCGDHTYMYHKSMKMSCIYLFFLPALAEILSVFQVRFCSFGWKILTFLCHLGFQLRVYQGSASLKCMTSRVQHPPRHFETQSGLQPLDLEVSLVT